MSAMVFLGVLPDLVLGSALTATDILKAATGPIWSRTKRTSDVETSASDLEQPEKIQSLLERTS